MIPTVSNFLLSTPNAKPISRVLEAAFHTLSFLNDVSRFRVALSEVNKFTMNSKNHNYFLETVTYWWPHACILVYILT